MGVNHHSRTASNSTPISTTIAAADAALNSPSPTSLKPPSHSRKGSHSHNRKGSHSRTHHRKGSHSRGHNHHHHHPNCPKAKAAIIAAASNEDSNKNQNTKLQQQKKAFEQQKIDTVAKIREKYTDLDSSVDDYELARFAVARSFDVDASINMHRKQVEWRKKNNMDKLPIPGINGNPLLQNIRGFSSVPDGNFVLEKEGVPSYLNKWYNCLGGGCFHKTDKHGLPIFIERTGYHDVKGLGAKCPPDQLLDWHIRNNEFIFDILMKECSEKVGHNVDKHVVIFDCQGLGLWQFDMKGMSLLKALSDLDSKVYPERLSKLFIVNTPSIFSKAWNLVKGWVDPGILEKIFICGSDYKQVLLEHVPAENLPSFLGGKCLCNLPGGCVPSPYLESHGGQDPDFMSTVTLQSQKHVFEFTVPEGHVTETDPGTVSYKFRSSKKGVVFNVSHEAEGKSNIIVKPLSVTNHKDIIEATFPASQGTYFFTWEKQSSGFSLFGDSTSIDYTVDFVSSKKHEDSQCESFDSLAGTCDCWNNQVSESEQNVNDIANDTN